MKKNQSPFTEQNSLAQLVFESVADGVVVSDLSTGLVVEANPAMAEMHGYRREEIIGRPISALIHPESQQLLTQYQQTLQTETLPRTAALHVRQDGAVLKVEWRGSIFTDAEGHPYLFLTVHEISQQLEESLNRRLLEERANEQAKLLEISEAFLSALEVKPGFILEQFRGIIDYTHAGLFTVEESTLLVLTTHNPEQLEQAPPLNIQLDVPETLTTLFKRQRPIRVPDVGGDDPAARFVWSFLGNEAAALLKGARSWMWVPLAVKGRLIAVIGLAHSEPDYFNTRHADIAMTLANQVAITLVNAELFEDAQALAVLQERQRLARNLHDAVNQSLFSAGLIAEVLPRLWEENAAEARQSLEDLRILIRGAIAEMRMLVAELRPLALTESNLGDLLHQLANSFTGRTNIPVAVGVTGDDTLVSEVQVAFYRICQEALNNIAKHANARQVRIRLHYAKDRVEMRIQDNGRGFDPHQAMPGHYGLSMMYERAESAGTTLEILSKPGKGTEIILRWQANQKQETP